MGRLIEADNLKRYIIETYRDPIIVCNDEVHFVAEIIDDYPTVEAIPKDQYEARLKADLKAILVELQLQFEEKGCKDMRDCWWLIEEKINSLKENTDVC